MKKDFLDEVIDARSRNDPDFRRLVEEATVRREIARRLASQREKKGLSQTLVAARMGTSQSVVSKLEAGADVKVSTLQRYCAALGKALPTALAAGAPMKRPRHRRAG